jgi:circadian clock protein KaiC
MKQKINLVQTGISLVDKAWGGFYRGGTYLLLGQRKTGKTLIGLQYAMESAKNREVCLYFTSMRPKDLMIHAASIDLDLQTYMNHNLIIVVRVAPPSDIHESGNPDGYLVEYLNDIVTVVEQYQPSRIVFDELTYFVGFENINLLQQTFLNTVEKIEDKNITSLFILAEPATPVAQMIVDSVVQYSTAVIYLQKKSEEESNTPGGRATITPNIGHTEGQFVSDYFIESYKGVTFMYEEKPKIKSHSPFEDGSQANNGLPDLSKLKKPNDSNKKFTPLTNVDPVPDRFSFSNLYELNEFKLILNNQIALYKSTGQPFVVLALRLAPDAEKHKLLTINQLQNTIRLSTDKKDKICVVDNNIILLMSKADEKAVNMMVSKIKSNLPYTDPAYVDVMMQHIYSFTYFVNENVQNADFIFSELLEDESK